MKKTAVVFLLCAWIMWSQDKTENWHALEGFPTYEKCTIAAKEILVINKEKSGRQIYWKCFPDTVDPRQKK